MFSLDNNTGNYLTVYKRMSSDSFEMCLQNDFPNHIDCISVKQYLALKSQVFDMP